MSILVTCTQGGKTELLDPEAQQEELGKQEEFAGSKQAHEAGETQTLGRAKILKFMISP